MQETEIVEAGGESPPSIKGIAICGSNPATINMAPFDDPEWLIYACSPDNVNFWDLPRVDQWFELHDHFPHASRSLLYWEKLKKMPLVWMRDPTAVVHVKGALPYPEDAALNLVGPFTLYTSSIAFMMAKAILDCQVHNIPNIGLFGIMQRGETEYTYQKPGIQNCIFAADRMGIKVIAPDISKLFEVTPYEW